MYLSASSIAIKKNQDYADFITNDDMQVLIICDGIGEFDDSGQVSKLVVDRFIEMQYSSISDLCCDEEIKKQKESAIKGGTTIIHACCSKIGDYVKIEYLGNGGVIHFSGDFTINPNTKLPYRYAELMLPHVAPDSALTKHLSHHSGKEELIYSEISIKLNNQCGDIILLFTDGISSLEDRVILKDPNGRYWRYEAASLQYILNELNTFLFNVNYDDVQEQLNSFANEVLLKLKTHNFLEDDASLGIILTTKVIDYYKMVKHD